MKYEFVNPHQSPPGGWYYIYTPNPENDDGKEYVRVSSHTEKDLFLEVAKLYRIRGEEPPVNLREMIVSQICERIPSKWCKGRSEGLGDTVYKITKSTGLARYVKRRSEIKQKPCNCSKRQKRLNEMFPYRS